jgi:hypothetical protein
MGTISDVKRLIDLSNICGAVVMFVKNVFSNLVCL